MRYKRKLFLCLLTIISVLSLQVFSGMVYATTAATTKEDNTSDVTTSDIPAPEEHPTNAPTSETPAFQPKILVTKSVTNPKKVNAGQDFKLSITIKNTSSSMAIKELTILLAPSPEQFALLSATDSIYVKTLKANKEMTVTYKLKAMETIQKGQYSVPLSFDYTDANGIPYTAAGNARVNVSKGAETEMQPNVIVTKSETNPKTVKAGEEFNLSITYKNISNDKALKDMTVMIAPPAEQFILCDSTDSIYQSSLGAGSKKTISYKLKAKSSVENGQYTVPLTFTYLDDKGTPYSTQGNARVDIKNPKESSELRVNFDQPVMPSEAQIGEIINLDVGIQNLSNTKVYNIRAVVETDGLNQMETLYVGEMEPRTNTTGSCQLTVSGLTESNSSYGPTTGKITFYYEDESGKEYNKEQEITLNILSPFSNQEQNEPDNPTQWWIIITVIVIVLAGFLVVYFIRNFSKKEGV